MVKTMRKHPILIAIIGFVIGYCGIKFLPYSNDDYTGILARFGLGAVLVGIMLLMGAKDSLKIFKKGFGFSLRTGLYFLIIALVVAVGAIIAGIQQNNGAPDNVVMSEISTFVLCLTIGLFEESMFRGVMLQGIIRKTGKTFKGLWVAVIISSILFGAIHVDSYIFGGSYDLAGIIQTIGKILQSGIFGVLLSAIYLKTRNFWGICVVHALNDFFAFQANIFKATTSGIGASGYVHTGDTAGMMVISYGVMTLFFLPALIKAIKMLKKTKLPEYGVFEDE